MAERTLNNRQVEVWKWIDDGCPAGVMDGFPHKTTAVALRSRRLVQIEKKRDSWNAVLTDAGKYFRDHGAYQRATGQHTSERMSLNILHQAKPSRSAA